MSAVRKNSDEAVPARVLLADDDAEIRAMVASALRHDGWDVVEVSNGSQLLDQLTRRMLRTDQGDQVDLVISDVRMPGRSGLDVLAGMRWAAWPSVPVIVMTAFGDGQTHTEARRLGAAAIFDKPFELYDLRAAALAVLRRPGTTCEPRPST